MSDTPLFPASAAAEALSTLVVVDEEGERIGLVAGLYEDTDAGTLEWAVVDAGVLGRHHVVPLGDAVVTDTFVQVGYDLAHVKLAPSIDEGADIDTGTEHALYEHYGLAWVDEPAGEGTEPDGVVADGSHRVVTRQPSLLRRILYSGPA